MPALCVAESSLDLIPVSESGSGGVWIDGSVLVAAASVLCLVERYRGSFLKTSDSVKCQAADGVGDFVSGWPNALTGS
jgi:hypothetical protein